MDATVTAPGMSLLLESGGLTQERRLYLWKSVREYFHADFRDEMHVP